MSMDSRPTRSALFKRAEQLKRWEQSDTNRESSVLKGENRKIKFSAGCVFLAACAAGDKEEVLSLLQKGADIDTSNVDGLSALHQACIDDNLDMVEFLIARGADINKGDNEGWTPLHATASCGFLSIAKYLIEMGANVAAVNHDGELPVDIAESDEMEDMLQQQIDDRGIDAEDTRNEEQRVMLEDAKNWLQTGRIVEKVHPKSGASSLHVAAAKGYIKVMEILIEAGSDLDSTDNDGWTPLHAAAHWGQREAAKILVEHFCDMDAKNYVGQTAFDVADSQMVSYLEELRKKQSSLSRDNLINKKRNNNNIHPLEPLEKSLKSEISDQIKTDQEADLINDIKNEVPEIPQIEVQIQRIPVPNQIERKLKLYLKNEPIRTSSEEMSKQVPNVPAPSLPPKTSPVDDEETGVPSWRRPAARSRDETPKFNLPLRLSDKEDARSKQGLSTAKAETAQEVVLRRTQSFEADEKFYRRYLELRAKINANNKDYPAISSPARSASLKEKHFARRGQVKEDPRTGGSSSVGATPSASIPPSSIVNPPVAATQSGPAAVPSASPAVSPGTATTNAVLSTASSPSSSPQHNANQVRRSFVPPVRDEESETQRKAHAKRVRETRRSTQGVTLEEIKSAEQLVKKKQQEAAIAAVSSSDVPVVTATITAASTAFTATDTTTSPVSESGVPDATFTFTSKRKDSPPADDKAEASGTIVIGGSRRGSAAERLAATVASAQTSGGGSSGSISERLNDRLTSGGTGITQTNNSSTGLSSYERRFSGQSSAVSGSEESNGGNSGVGVVSVSAAALGAQDRRPSWRLKVNNGSKFMLEDARSSNEQEKSKSMLGLDQDGRSAVKGLTDTGDTTVTLPLRKNRTEEREQDKENDARSALATQGVIQRRRRPKRRSTGVVHVDMDEIDPDRTADSGEGCLSDGDTSPRVNSLESETEKENTEQAQRVSRSESKEASENGEIDYKKLYEESQEENQRLRDRLKKTNDDLSRAKLMAEKAPYVPMRNSLSEAEKREKKAMERKLAEMEEELKQLQKLKADNERLRAENRALTRVVSKLTASQNAIRTT